MKKKNRRITINEKVYLYNVQSQHCENDLAIVTLRVFLAGNANTPYIFKFKMLDDYYAGAPLYAGVSLLNKQTGLLEYVSLNRPYYVRLFILYALSEGWNALQQCINEYGMDVLAHLNLDISTIAYADGY